jgi:hypothetical protein
VAWAGNRAALPIAQSDGQMITETRVRSDGPNGDYVEGRRELSQGRQRVSPAGER